MSEPQGNDRRWVIGPEDRGYGTFCSPYRPRERTAVVPESRAVAAEAERDEAEATVRYLIAEKRAAESALAEALDVIRAVCDLDPQDIDSQLLDEARRFLVVHGLGGAG